MPLILHIDTSIDAASICLSKDDEVLFSNRNDNIKDQASWLQAAIAEMMIESGHNISKLDAVAVTNGPGSYTGLRVGLASAKGICYALKIPLITIGTLELMASKAKGNDADLFCPMIDARRMEVFTALYDRDLNEVEKPHALILDENSFEKLLSVKKILFFGNGSEKFQSIIKSDNAFFNNIKFEAFDMVVPAIQHFKNGNFADLAYAEPAYIKDFFTSSSTYTTKTRTM